MFYQIEDKKLQYVITREAAKISALSSGKVNKYEYITGEEILPSNQKQIIEQAKGFFLNFKGLSDGRVVSLTKKEYGSAVNCL